MLIYAGWLPHDLGSSRSCLSLLAGVLNSHSRNEDSPFRSHTSSGKREKVSYAMVSCICLSMAHIKAPNSRAMAVTVACLDLPLAISRR